MRIYYETDRNHEFIGNHCITECTHKSAMVGSRACQECEDNKGYCKLEKWVACAKEIDMKVEETTMQFIRDDNGDRWFIRAEETDHMSYTSAEYLYSELVADGLLTTDPLQKANDALDEAIGRVNQWWLVRDIMKKLYEDMK